MGDLREIRDTYFKDSGDGRRYMSGTPLPRDMDGVVRKVRFINCDFHPSCQNAEFEGCEFEGCEFWYDRG